MAYDYIQGLAKALGAAGGTPYINKFGLKVVPYKPVMPTPEPTDAQGFTQSGREQRIKRDERGNPIVTPQKIVGYEKEFSGKLSYDPVTAGKALIDSFKKRKSFVDAAMANYKPKTYSAQTSDPFVLQQRRIREASNRNKAAQQVQQAFAQTPEGREFASLRFQTLYNNIK